MTTWCSGVSGGVAWSGCWGEGYVAIEGLKCGEGPSLDFRSKELRIIMELLFNNRHLLSDIGKASNL